MKLKIILTTFVLFLSHSLSQVKITVEPPISSGLVVDSHNSYIEKLTVKTISFPAQKPISLLQLMRDIYQKMTTPYTDRFPITWQDNEKILQVIQAEEKVYFSNSKATDLIKTNARTISWKTTPDEMYQLNLQWFDAEDNQFYQSELIVNTTKLYALNQALFLAHRFDQLLIDIVEGGKYALWLSAPDFKIQFSDHISANKIEYNWETFKQGAINNQLTNLSQSEYSELIAYREITPYYNLRFAIKDQHDVPIDDFKYHVVRQDGQTYCGTTNTEGMTKVFIADQPTTFDSYDDASDCPRINAGTAMNE